MGPSQSQRSGRHISRCMGHLPITWTPRCLFNPSFPGGPGWDRTTSRGQSDACGKGSGNFCLFLTREGLPGPLLTSPCKAYEDMFSPGSRGLLGYPPSLPTFPTHPCSHSSLEHPHLPCCHQALTRQPFQVLSSSRIRDKGPGLAQSAG